MSGERATGYDPTRSNVKDDRLSEFLREPISGRLQDVPGIGDKAAERLAAGEDPNEQITNTFQLIGKFLMLRGPDTADHQVTSAEQCDKFWSFLQSKGISSYRSGIVQCIAEKVNLMMPGIYDEEQFKS